MEILIYITCFVVIAYIVYSVLSIKSKSPGDDILSSQITNLSERFAVIEEAAKQINSTQNTIDETFKNIITNNDYLMIKGSNATGLNTISKEMIKGTNVI